MGEVANLLTGFPFESKKFVREGIKLVRGMNVKRGYLDFSEELCEYWSSSQGLENYLLNSGDILIQMDGALIGKSYAKIKENQLPALLVQRVTRVRIQNQIADESFVYQQIQKGFLTYIKGTKTETAVPHLSLNDIESFEIATPSVDEEKKIGAFFESLDHLITLHQRKYDKLQVLKKAMLEKMFPKNGSSVPEIRFKGFTDAWEQRKLGDNIVEYTEVTTENNQYPPLTSSRKGIFLQTEYFAGNQIASDDNTGYNIVPYGYFTYRHMSDDEVFHFNINDIVEKGIVSTLYPVFTTDENLDSRYLQYQLNYGHEFAKFAILQKQGGSRTYMYLNKLRQLHLTMPNHVEEQKEISSFFMNLDHLITLHQRELEKLQNIKKSMLEKMFV